MQYFISFVDKYYFNVFLFLGFQISQISGFLVILHMAGKGSKFFSWT